MGGVHALVNPRMGGADIGFLMAHSPNDSSLSRHRSAPVRHSGKGVRSPAVQVGSMDSPAEVAPRFRLRG